MLTFPSSCGNANQAEAGCSSSQGTSTVSETHFIGSQTESSDSSPMLTFPSSSGNGNQAEAGPSSSQGISTISETHFIGNQTESSDSSPMLTFPSSSGNGNQAEAGPSSSQGISTISETHFIGSQTESTAHPLEGTSLGPLTNNDHITMEKFDVDIALIMPKIKEHIYSTDILNNPVEILRYVQSQLVRGRTLDVLDESRCEVGITNYILVDRLHLLETAFDEISDLENLFLTLEVQFYGEVAEDFGGPRKEFFSLCVKAIKEKYFDDGLLNHQAEAYYLVGVILGMLLFHSSLKNE
ncbi:Fibronectin type 3 and ankyrin repeat domains protein 1 [Porites harrisoni]